MTAPALSVSTPNGRYYANPVTRQRVPSITNIKDKKGIGGLKYWAAREAAEYAADNLGKLGALTHDEAVSLIKGAPFARTSAKAEASAIGDCVHDWVDRTIKGQAIPEAEFTQAHQRARRMWSAFARFLSVYKPQWIDSEFTVWSDTHGYAGTADWAAYIGGACVLGDTKTGNRVYDDTGMQLAALANADYILEADGKTRPLPKFDRFAVLHLRPTQAKLIPFENEAVAAAFGEFLALKVVFDYDVSFKDKVQLYAPVLKAAA